MIRHSRVLVGAVLAFAFVVARPTWADSVSAQDRQFMEETAKGSMLEVHMGHMGVEKAMNPAVKSYSQRLINDHTKANQELTALAKKKGVTLPADDSKMASSMPIAKKSGADFDKEFAMSMIDDHSKVIAAFEKEIASGSDPDVKAWASKTLPTLREHLSEARALPK